MFKIFKKIENYHKMKRIIKAQRENINFQENYINFLEAVISQDTVQEEIVFKISNLSITEQERNYIYNCCVNNGDNETIALKKLEFEKLLNKD